MSFIVTGQDANWVLVQVQETLTIKLAAFLKLYKCEDCLKCVLGLLGVAEYLTSLVEIIVGLLEVFYSFIIITRVIIVRGS